MRRYTQAGPILALTVLVSCGVTGPPASPARAFAGTLLVERPEVPVERPIGLDALSREFAVALDLSPYYPGDDPANYPNLIRDFDASPSGEFLYAAVSTKVVRTVLPAGGALHEVIDLGHPVNKVRVSPDGSRLAARLAIMSDVVVFNADGTGARLALRPDPLVSIGPPVWIGNDRILIVEQRSTLEGQRFRFLDLRAPSWTPVEYAPFEGVIAKGDGGVFVLAPADGNRVYLHSCSDEPFWFCRIVEYPIDSPHGTPRLVTPDETIGGSWVLSPDGSQIATRRVDQIIVFDLRTGAQVGELLGKSGRTESPVTWVTAEYP